jgi:serine/threonine protein phosphatase 1
LPAVFDKLLGKRQAAGQPAYPAGKRMYCIGDVHGCLGLLQDLHARIRDDAAGFSGQCQVLYVGDYIDRGEASAQVIEELLSEPLAGFEAIHLAGNHEHALLDFLADPVAMAGWLEWGGMATLRSYGINAGLIASREALQGVRDALEKAIPQAHLDFYRSGLTAHREGDYYFVHAGIKPGRALERQVIEDQLWIRGEFTNSRRDHGAVVVHGHTISEEAELLPNRIGIDTGAYQSGVLTCLVLEGEEQRLIQTGARS